jgi:hypothetical protein
LICLLFRDLFGVLQFARFALKCNLPRIQDGDRKITEQFVQAGNGKGSETVDQLGRTAHFLTFRVAFNVDRMI